MTILLRRLAPGRYRPFRRCSSWHSSVAPRHRHLRLDWKHKQQCRHRHQLHLIWNGSFALPTNRKCCARWSTLQAQMKHHQRLLLQQTPTLVPSRLLPMDWPSCDGAWSHHRPDCLYGFHRHRCRLQKVQSNRNVSLCQKEGQSIRHQQMGATTSVSLSSRQTQNSSFSFFFLSFSSSSSSSSYSYSYTALLWAAWQRHHCCHHPRLLICQSWVPFCSNALREMGRG